MVLEFRVFVVENIDREKFEEKLSERLNKMSQPREPIKIDVSYSTSHLHDDVYMYSALVTVSQPSID